MIAVWVQPWAAKRSASSTPGLDHYFSYQAELLLQRSLLSLPTRCSSCCTAIWFGIILVFLLGLAVKMISLVFLGVCVFRGVESLSYNLPVSLPSLSPPNIFPDA